MPKYLTAMIYPEVFPDERKNEHAEKKVFEQLSKVSGEYDIFYSKRFVTDGVGKKPEFEIDFIIAIPEKAILCLEVKGGQIKYDGMQDVWFQNNNRMHKKPDVQATDNAHALLNTFKTLIADMPIGWGLCFPDCSVSNFKSLPSNLTESQIIDSEKLLYVEHSIKDSFKHLKERHSHLEGCRKWQYEKFKTLLLRNIGFVQLLSTRIKYDNNRFIELTDFQLGLFKRSASNKRMITTGPAGSGKTIVAKTMAQDFLNKGLRVLFMCYNRTLVNKVRYEFDRDETNLDVTTYHSFARRIIDENDKEWWQSKIQSKSADFWELEVPIKLEEYIASERNSYDAIIIDEGQDFKELWFEQVFALAKSDAHILVFLDAMQNIFGHFSNIPSSEGFFYYELPENCRNTKNIVNYLSDLTQTEIKTFERNPLGDDVVQKTFDSDKDQANYLVEEIETLLKHQNISPEQILILLNSKKSESCIKDLDKINKLKIKAIDNKGRLQNDSINYTTISTYKGLEADIVFIVDAQKIPEQEQKYMLYTEASRARFKVLVLYSV